LIHTSLTYTDLILGLHMFVSANYLLCHALHWLSPSVARVFWSWLYQVGDRALAFSATGPVMHAPTKTWNVADRHSRENSC